MISIHFKTFLVAILDLFGSPLLHPLKTRISQKSFPHQKMTIFFFFFFFFLSWWQWLIFHTNCTQMVAILNLGAQPTSFEYE